MSKAAIIVLAGTVGHDNLGRAVNALMSASEFKEAGDDTTIVFDGAGTQWVPELMNPDSEAHKLFAGVRDKVAGACSYCAGAFGVRDKIEELGVPLLDEYKKHPSVRSLMADGYQVITF